jgi:hypothetical protein
MADIHFVFTLEDGEEEEEEEEKEVICDKLNGNVADVVM